MRCAAAQRGQSMAEFLVALAVLLPLFLAVTYAGRYGDLLQETTQASRYAAFQRVMQPDQGKLSDAQIQSTMRARFFVGGTAVNNGAIQSDDNDSEVTDQHMPAMWRDLSGNALLASANDVSLNFTSAPVGSTRIAGVMNTVSKFAGNKSWSGSNAMQQTAQVEVKLSNMLDLSTESPAPLVIAAATASVTNDLGSAGNDDTRNAAESASVRGVERRTVGRWQRYIDIVMIPFEECAPVFSYDPVDVVPARRLDTYHAPSKPCN
jgi:hypothetical protein